MNRPQDRRPLLIAALSLLALGGMVLAAAPKSGFAMAPLIVEAHEAAVEIVERSDVVLLDARRPDDRAQIRLHRSHYAPYGDWLRKNRRDPGAADFLDQWHADLAHLGIGPPTRVFIYGGRGSYTAPGIVWYALQGVGVTGASVVNGGFEALAAALPGSWLDWMPEPLGPAFAGPVRADVLQPTHVAAHSRQAFKEDVLARVMEGGSGLVDTRTAQEYSGENDLRNPRPGRIPGAINLPHGLLREDSGRIKPPAEILRILAEAGIKSEDPLLVYCQGGGRSSFFALALLHAGFHDVRNYIGSFGQWSRDGRCPVQTEPAASH